MWTGAILGVTPALTALMSPFWGRLADRYGRRIMVARSLVSCAVVMGLMAFVTRPWHVFALRAALGFLHRLRRTDAVDGRGVGAARSDGRGDRHGADRPAARTGGRPGDRRPAGRRRRPASRVSRDRRAVYDRVAPRAAALRREARPNRASRPDAAPARISFRSVLAFENFLLLLGVVFGIQFVDRSVGPILPLYLEQIGITRPPVPVAAGLLFSVTALAASLGHHFCGRLLKRFSARVVISVAAAGAGAGAAMLGSGEVFG